MNTDIKPVNKTAESRDRNTGGILRRKAPFQPIPRYRKRTYSLNVHLPPLDDYAWDVVRSIEQPQIRVVDPVNGHALDCVTDTHGAILLDSDETMTVPLAQWLVVGCQSIRWRVWGDGPLDKGVVGTYKSNYSSIFGPCCAETRPPGPAIFTGEIVLPSSIKRAWLACKEDRKKAAGIANAVQLILAHELVHAFDLLKYLVPALLNWPGFWRNVLQEGCLNDELYTRIDDRSSFIDDYSGPNELAQIRYWWPSRADTWFGARRWLHMLSD